MAIKLKPKKGDRIPVKCNECICENGSWICTNDKCPGKCTFIGTDSVVTFDQMVYNFDADCSKYTLMHIPDHNIAVTLLNNQVKDFFKFLSNIFYFRCIRWIFKFEMKRSKSKEIFQY